MKRRLSAPAIDPATAVEWFLRAGDDQFAATPFKGFALFPSIVVAERMWPQCRRPVWLQTRRMEVPRPARVFDRLQLGAPRFVWEKWQRIVFPEWEAFDKIREDHERLNIFEHEQPGASREIADMLDLVRQDLGLLGRQVRALAKLTVPHRAYPPNEWPKTNYSGEPWQTATESR
jgi:hypothetical protein